MMSLLLAAGNGNRFAAYAQIKPMLSMPDGRPLIAWVCDQVPVGECVAVVRAQDIALLSPWLGDVQLIALDSVTAGPLASARAACAHLNGELLIVYCDVLLDCGGFVAAARASGAPYACVTFTSRDPRYGYWDGTRVVEKVVVSDRAVSGAFYFRAAADFTRRAAVVGGAAGVPALLDEQTFCYHTDAVIDIGTPTDYEAFMSEAIHG